MTPEPLELLLFSSDPVLAAPSLAAGVDGLVVDWEWRGKEQRQRGADTEINREGPQDLLRAASLRPRTLVCRINGVGPWSPGEIQTAVDAGASDVLLPMVRGPVEVETFLDLVDGRARGGILVETIAACARVRELARFPLDRVYLGLNDLAIDRGSPTIFSAFEDGTVDRVREAFSHTRFGVAGLTAFDLGHPIPCRLLLAEMARLGCGFTFLRRSFKRDIAGRSLVQVVGRLRDEWRRLHLRSQDDVTADRAELLASIRGEAAAGGLA